MLIHLVGLRRRSAKRVSDARWLDDTPDEEIRAGSTTVRAPGSWRRCTLSICAFLALVFVNLGCSRAAPKPAEKVPPAPIKWEEARQLVLEEWTELVGSTQPLPDRTARVTSPVPGRVLVVLPHRYDLRLLSALNDVNQLPNTGKNLIVVASVKNLLHFRIFGSGGGPVDLDEKKFAEQAQQIEALRTHLRTMWPPHELTASEKDGITTTVMSIVGPSLPNGDAKSIVEGQSVEEGDVLVRLDATAVLANLAKAEAAKKVLQAEREGASSAVKQAALEVKSLEDLKRTSPTLPVSSVAMEKARLALESAQAALLAIDRKLEAADKEEAALNLEIRLYTLTAPRKGRLGRLQVVVGQTLPAGATVAELIDIDDEIDVLCFVPAADARKLQLGQQARIGGFEKDPANDAGADPEGKVVYIADQAEAETGSFAVKIRFPNRDLKFRANAVARVRILTKPGKACWAVPEAALMEDEERPSIAVVEDVAVTKNAEGKEEQTGKIRRLRAEIGARDRVLKSVEIVRLYDDEKKWRGDLEHALIVIAKGQGLQTGDAVKLEVEDDDDAPKP
jgi:multidrug efflux pump subunit AcrA (membrane-fusion protein)